MNKLKLGLIALMFSASALPSWAAETPAATPVPTVAGADALGQALPAVLQGDWRLAKNRARDLYRHPAETLAFFQLRPDASVIEVNPGTGWYSEILAPLLGWQGVYVGAVPNVTATSPKELVANDSTLRSRFAADPRHFGGAKLLGYDPAAPDFGPPESADIVLTFRNVHNWVKAGNAPAYFQAFYKVLRSGGILGIEDHRARPGSALDLNSGYLPTEYVIKLATDAGFRLDASSEINANPNDTKDYPKGVWTLPPTLALGDQDRAKYLAIGESDRFTLRFVKADPAEQEADTAIRQAIADWDAGWRTFDPELVSRDYADDADWINAFGERRTGREQIKAYLAHGFTSPQWAGRHTTPSTVSIRFLGPDLAAVSSSRQTTGQKSGSGRAYSTRHTHDLRLFARRNGRWLIVSHQIMDEKDALP